MRPDGGTAGDNSSGKVPPEKTKQHEFEAATAGHPKPMPDQEYAAWDLAVTPSTASTKARNDQVRSYR